MPSKRNVLCQFYQRGLCNKGDDCSWSHGARTEISRPAPYANAVPRTPRRQDRQDRQEGRQAIDLTCSIYLEHVMTNPNCSVEDRCFGLMDCKHVFCLACVRDWRSQKDKVLDYKGAVLTCPECRQPTHFVTPSKVWPRSVQQKAEIVNRYKAKLGSIECKYWKQSPDGAKSCPFGNSCLYQHPKAKVAEPFFGIPCSTCTKA